MRTSSPTLVGTEQERAQLLRDPQGATGDRPLRQALPAVSARETVRDPNGPRRPSLWRGCSGLRSRSDRTQGGWSCLESVRLLVVQHCLTPDQLAP